MTTGSRPSPGTAALEARAHAGLDTRRATHARDAIRQAEAILARLSPADTIPSAFGYDEAQLRFHEGSTYTHLRDTVAAWKAQKRALALVPERDYTDRTLVHLDRAICLAHDGDSREALSYTTTTLASLNEQQRQGIITARARDTLRAIKPADRSLPGVADLQDLLLPTSETE